MASSWPFLSDDTHDQAFYESEEFVDLAELAGGEWPALKDDQIRRLQDAVGHFGDDGSDDTVYGRLHRLESKVEPMTAVPAFCDRCLTYPDAVTTNHHYTLSVVSGKLRVTAGAGTTDGNLRRAYGLIPAGVMGDSEVRSTISASSVDWDGVGRFQPGHVHRMRAERIVLDSGLCTSATSTTLSDSTKSWSTSPKQFSGLRQGGREVYIKLVAGTGSPDGQIQKVINNTGTQVTVPAAWSTNPSTDTYYEIFTYAVNCVSLVLGPIAFGIHAGLQPTVWDNGTFSTAAMGAGEDVTGYLGVSPSEDPLPWKLKSRVVGNTLEAAIWKAADAEPAYGTSGKSGSWTLAPGFGDTPGMSGLYVGHLDYDSGDWLEFDDVTVTRL